MQLCNHCEPVYKLNSQENIIFGYMYIVLCVRERERERETVNTTSLTLTALDLEGERGSVPPCTGPSVMAFGSTTTLSSKAPTERRLSLK